VRTWAADKLDLPYFSKNVTCLLRRDLALLTIQGSKWREGNNTQASRETLLHQKFKIAVVEL
jgi:hypothetical protein